MKKIMFNDKYGLTDAVLQGRKTMTRRVIHLTDTDKEYLDTAFDWDFRESVIIDQYAKYKIGEVVAVAQSYKNLGYTKEWVEQHISPNPNAKPTDPFEKKYPGWSNKMFVPAELNKTHRIRITDIKVERLQDISDEDCMCEGLVKGMITYGIRFEGGCLLAYSTPREAFADLIDAVSGKGTWERNPWVFAYSFELCK